MVRTDRISARCPGKVQRIRVTSLDLCLYPPICCFHFSWNHKPQKMNHYVESHPRSSVRQFWIGAKERRLYTTFLTWVYQWLETELMPLLCHFRHPLLPRIWFKHFCYSRIKKCSIKFGMIHRPRTRFPVCSECASLCFLCNFDHILNTFSLYHCSELFLS